MDHNPEELRDRIRSIVNLPTLPDIAAQIMRAVLSPDTSTSDVAAIVAQDISLSAKALRLANSAFYGMPKSVTTLTNAVVILGFKAIQTMVLSLTVFDMFSGDNRGSAPRTLFDRAAFWRHSLECAVTARLIVKRRGKDTHFALDPEEAFCAGLLHDIGKVVMEQYLNADFHRALHHARIYGVNSFEAEKATLGYTHCDVAAWLTETWMLPDNIAMPLYGHHEPHLAKNASDAITVCHIADMMANAAGVQELDAMANALAQKAAALGLTENDLRDVIEMIPDEMEKASLFIM